MDTKNLLVIRVRGIIDHKRSKELTKIYKEQLGEQPFIIIDDEVREIEPFYDYRESNQTEQQEITYNTDLVDLSAKAPVLPNSGTIPLVFQEGKVADVKIKDGEIKGVYPGGPIKDLDSLMNAGKNESFDDVDFNEDEEK